MQAQRDYNKQLLAQVRFTGGETHPYGHQVAMPINVDMSPQAVRARNQRLNEMNQRLAAVKRKGKPSYRQRQKNARAAAGR